MNKIDSIRNEIYIIGDFSINLSLNDSYVFSKNVLSNKSVPSDVKSYYKFCAFFSSPELIKIPTLMTWKSATIIDHILASYLEKITQQGINDVRLCIHQLIFCIGNISRIKRVTQKHIKFRFFKYYSAELFKETLTSINFSKYPNFNDATEAYDDFL